MYHVITFQIIAEGTPVEVGTIGATTPTNDYKPNVVKSEIERYYRLKTPSVKKVAVIFSEVRKVTNKEYINESKKFIKIPAKPH